MTESRQLVLLKDLAQLIKKHGPTTFADLAAFLRNPQGIDQLVRILEDASAAGAKACISQPRSQRAASADNDQSIQRFISVLEKESPEKGKIISNLYVPLQSKRALGSLRELRSFATDNGLRPVAAKSREKAIGPFLRDLASRPIDDMRSIVQRIRVFENISDRSLEGWTDVILNKQRPR